MVKKENFKFWGEDLEEDEKIMNAILDSTLGKDWLSSDEDEAWKNL